MNDLIGNVAVFIGVTLGCLAIIDFILLDKHKKWILGKSEKLWFYLDEQKSGKFISWILKTKIQKRLVILTHAFMVVLISSFLGKTYLNWNINVNFQVGHPRLYHSQIWIEIIVLFFSALFVSKYLHPLFIKRLDFKKTIKSYLTKSLKGLGLSFLAMFVIVIIELPITIPMFNLETPDDIQTHFGGYIVISILHLITSVISAPVLSEALLFLFMFFCSLYWVILVHLVFIISRILQFFLLRIIEHPKGPVLALGGLLTGIGLIIKSLIA